MSRRAGALLAVLAVSALLIGLARRADDAPATSDTAVIESYTLMASHGRLLVGAYSRFQWHHPGPLYFYVLAPFYALGGEKSAALNAGAAALSLGSLALAVVLLSRRDRLLGACASGVLALFAWRGAEAFASPWNPHVPVLPLVAALVASAEVLAGNAMALPLLALLASLAAQAHIALVPVTVALGAVAATRASAAAVTATDAARWRRALGITALVLSAAWALPIYEQLTATPRGNFTELLQFFLHRHTAGQPLPVAVSAWSDMVVGVLRPDFYVAHGWPFVESPVRWAESGALVISAVIALVGLRSWRRGDRFSAALTGVLLLASVVGLWSTTRIEDKIFDHDVFWLVGVGVASLVLVIHAVMRPLAGGVRSTGATVACIGLSLLAAGAVVQRLNVEVERSRTPSDEARTARLLAADIVGYMDSARVGRPLVKIDQDAWGVVAGAILDLQKRGRLVSVEQDWVVMFTPLFGPTGREDAVISVAMPAEHARLSSAGWPLISSHEPIYAHVSPVSE